MPLVTSLANYNFLQRIETTERHWESLERGIWFQHRELGIEFAYTQLRKNVKCARVGTRLRRTTQAESMRIDII